MGGGLNKNFSNASKDINNFNALIQQENEKLNKQNKAPRNQVSQPLKIGFVRNTLNN